MENADLSTAFNTMLRFFTVTKIDEALNGAPNFHRIITESIDKSHKPPETEKESQTIAATT